MKINKSLYLGGIGTLLGLCNCTAGTDTEPSQSERSAVEGNATDVREYQVGDDPFTWAVEGAHSSLGHFVMTLHLNPNLTRGDLSAGSYDSKRSSNLRWIEGAVSAKVEFDKPFVAWRVGLQARILQSCTPGPSDANEVQRFPENLSDRQESAIKNRVSASDKDRNHDPNFVRLRFDHGWPADFFKQMSSCTGYYPNDGYTPGSSYEYNPYSTVRVWWGVFGKDEGDEIREGWHDFDVSVVDFRPDVGVCGQIPAM